MLYKFTSYLFIYLLQILFNHPTYPELINIRLAYHGEPLWTAAAGLHARCLSCCPTNRKRWTLPAYL